MRIIARTTFLHRRVRLQAGKLYEAPEAVARYYVEIGWAIAQQDDDPGAAWVEPDVIENFPNGPPRPPANEVTLEIQSSVVTPTPGVETLLQAVEELRSPRALLPALAAFSMALRKVHREDPSAVRDFDYHWRLYQRSGHPEHGIQAFRALRESGVSLSEAQQDELLALMQMGAKTRKKDQRGTSRDLGIAQAIDWLMQPNPGNPEPYTLDQACEIIERATSWELSFDSIKKAYQREKRWHKGKKTPRPPG